MALNSTIYKVELQISDMDRHYYATHALTLARHPSETEERLMVRLLAFALYADDRPITVTDHDDDSSWTWTFEEQSRRPSIIDAHHFRRSGEAQRRPASVARRNDVLPSLTRSRDSNPKSPPVHARK